MTDNKVNIFNKARDVVENVAADRRGIRNMRQPFDTVGAFRGCGISFVDGFNNHPEK